MANPVPITFDARQHRYYSRGVPVPGFSEIRVAMGIGGTFKPRFLGEYLEEGTVLHQWLLLLAKGLEMEQAPDPIIAPRVEGIKEFLRNEPFHFVDGEKPMSCDSPLFACTPDIWGYWDGEPCLFEMKRSAKAKWHPLQTAAQAMALKCSGFEVKRRFSLYLREGGYVISEHTDRGDFSRWAALVYGFHARGWYL